MKLSVIATFFIIVIIASFIITTTTTTTLVSAAPTIVTDGASLTNMGASSGTFSAVTNAKLNVDESEVLFASTSSSAAVIAKVSPFAFDRKSTDGGSRQCTWDGQEVSNRENSLVFCRKRPAEANFWAFKMTTLAAHSIGQPILGAGAGVTAGTTGFFQVVVISSSSSRFLFTVTNQNDGRFIRVDLDNLQSTGDTLATTKVVTDGTQTFHQGACTSSHCYILSSTERLSKFATGDATTDPTFDSGIDVSSGITNAIGDYQNVVIDETNGFIFVSSTSGGAEIAKVNLAAFTFTPSDKLTISGSTSSSSVRLCQNCFTSGNEYMMILSGSPNKAVFVKTSDLTELTGTDTSISTSSNLIYTAYLHSYSNRGALINWLAEVQKISSTGVAITSTSTTTITTTTTTTPSPDNNNNDDSPSVGVIVGASVGSVVGVVVIAALIFYFCFYRVKKSDDNHHNQKQSDNVDENTDEKNNNKNQQDGDEIPMEIK